MRHVERGPYCHFAKKESQTDNVTRVDEKKIFTISCVIAVRMPAVPNDNGYECRLGFDLQANRRGE